MTTCLSEDEIEALLQDRKRLEFVLDQINARRTRPVSRDQARAAIDHEMQMKGEGSAA